MARVLVDLRCGIPTHGRRCGKRLGRIVESEAGPWLIPGDASTKAAAELWSLAGGTIADHSMTGEGTLTDRPGGVVLLECPRCDDVTVPAAELLAAAVEARQQDQPATRVVRLSAPGPWAVGTVASNCSGPAA